MTQRFDRSVGLSVVALVGLTLTLVVIGAFGHPLISGVGHFVGVAGSAAIVGITAHQRRNQDPERARGWAWISAGLLVFAASVIPQIFGPVSGQAYSGVELLGVPLTFVGLAILRRTLHAPRRAQRQAALDGALIGIAGVLLTWSLVFEPFVGGHFSSEVLAVGVFPLMSMLILSLWILPLMLLDRRSSVARWLVLMMAATLLVDLTSAIVDLATDLDRRQIRGLYGLTVIATALAATDRRMWLEGGIAREGGFLDRERIVLISVSLGIVPATLLAAAWLDFTPNHAVLGVGSGAMVGIVAVRLGQALHDADMLQNRLRASARLDPLTKLPNRRAAEERLAAIEHTAGTVAVFFIDLDGFKGVNDRRGHGVGDLLLRAVAERLSGCAREGDLVARFGGDEFVVVSPNLAESQAGAVAHRIRRAVAGAYDLDGEVEYIEASVGVALDRDHARRNTDELMRMADAAMYEAKATGRGQVILTASAGPGAAAGL